MVLLGGCVLVGIKLWNLQVRSLDPFTVPQDFTWRALTWLCVTHPLREMEPVTIESEVAKEIRNAVKEETRKQNEKKNEKKMFLKEKQEIHFKRD